MVIDEAGMIAQDLQNMRIEGELDRKNREAEVQPGYTGIVAGSVQRSRRRLMFVYSGQLIRILGAAILSNRRGPEGPHSHFRVR